MREMGTDRLRGSYADIARMVGCFPDEAERCIAELKRTGTASVTLGNADVTHNVTLVSRYIKKEVKARELTKLRVRKLRSNAHVTPVKRDIVRSKSKESEEEKKEEGKRTPPKDELGADILIVQTESVLNLKLLLAEKKTVRDAIPISFTPDWIVFLKARALKLGSDANRAGIIQTLGYALTDYRRDNKKAYEQLNRPEAKLPSAAEVQQQREDYRRQPRTNPDGSAFIMQGLPETGRPN